MSRVRDHIREILTILGEATGYQVHKLYTRVYGRITLRNVYYHLHRLLSDGEARLRSEDATGDYSWGRETVRKYYQLIEPVSIDERRKNQLLREAKALGFLKE